jgi:hypothetical protein
MSEDGQDHASTPRPDALIPAFDEGRLAALREIGREWDRVSADRQVWRQALPVDPSLGEYPRGQRGPPGPLTGRRWRWACSAFPHGWAGSSSGRSPCGCSAA